MRRFPEDTTIIDPGEIIRPWPVWAKLSLLVSLCYGCWSTVTRTRAPGEPQLAIFWTLLFLAATIVLSELLRPKPKLEDARPAGLGDFRFPTATEDRVVPLIFGRVKVEGPNVIWYGDLDWKPITQYVKTGLWSGKRVTTGFQYSIGFQMGLCRGPDVECTRIWIGEKELWTGSLSTDGATADIDDDKFLGGESLGNGGISATFEFYTGSKTQAVSTYLGLHQDAGAGTNRTPRYTGTCHMVVRGYQTTTKGAYVGNSTQIEGYSYELKRYPALFGSQTGSDHKVGDECGLMNVAYEILTNTEWGFGFPSSDIDIAAFEAAATTLKTEVNGFSMVVDRAMTASDLLQEVERQMDGKVFLDHSTGEWTVKLARADYNINTIPQLNHSNVEAVTDFTRSGWEDTTNSLRLKHTIRETDDDGNVNYKETFATASDPGNALIQGGGSVSTFNQVVGNINFPGVMTAANASILVWRELRTQSYPLARCKFVIDRSFWDLTIVDVVAWTGSIGGYDFVKLPMRITHIDYGKLTKNRITVTAVQDVFKFAAASGGTAPGTLWSPPKVSLVAYPSDEILVEEAARALITRDPAYGGNPNVSKVFASARRQGGESSFDITERNAVGTPSGSYAVAGEVFAFQKIGELTSALPPGVANPSSAFTVTPTPDSQIDIESAFVDTASVTDLGVDLVQLIKVGTEFMLVTSASNNGGNVDLEDVYRGALDSGQADHAAGTEVFLIHLGAGLTDTSFVPTNNVDVALRMKGPAGAFTGSVTPVALTMAKRAQRPYPPAAPRYNTPAGAQHGTPDVEGDGSGLNGLGFDVNWDRRDYRTTDEVAALLADDTGVDSSTEYRTTVFVDPAGVNTQVYQSSWATGTGPNFVNRLLLWEVAAAGTKIRVQIEARHASPVDGTVLTSRYSMLDDTVPTSVRDGDFYLGGALRASTVSNLYTALATGTYTLRIGAAYTTSNVQVRLNGGSWVTIIAAAATSGTFAVTTNDTIEVQHTVNETPSDNYVELEDPSTNIVAYGTLSD